MRGAGRADPSNARVGLRAGLACRSTGRDRRATTATTRRLAAALEGTPVVYHMPPARFAPGRDGAAKAGNLNSALALIGSEFPDIRYVETRDADDELARRTSSVRRSGSSRLTRGSLSSRRSRRPRSRPATRSTTARRSSTAARCSPGTQPTQRSPAARGSFGAAGAGRDRRVPDLEPRRGPPVRRRGPSSRLGRALPADRRCRSTALPEDLPNVYKQRGTWALDSVRLVSGET